MAAPPQASPVEDLLVMAAAMAVHLVLTVAAGLVVILVMVALEQLLVLVAPLPAVVVVLVVAPTEAVVAWEYLGKEQVVPYEVLLHLAVLAVRAAPRAETPLAAVVVVRTVVVAVAPAVEVRLTPKAAVAQFASSGVWAVHFRPHILLTKHKNKKHKLII